MTDRDPTPTPFDFWCVCELMGRVRLGGRAREETHLGQAMLRLDIPGADGELRTRWFGGGAIYSISPCSEELARMVAAGVDPAPVKRWELPARREPDGYGPDEDHGVYGPGANQDNADLYEEEDDEPAVLLGPETRP